MTLHSNADRNRLPLCTTCHVRVRRAEDFDAYGGIVRRSCGYLYGTAVCANLTDGSGHSGPDLLRFVQQQQSGGRESDGVRRLAGAMYDSKVLHHACEAVLAVPASYGGDFNGMMLFYVPAVWDLAGAMCWVGDMVETLIPPTHGTVIPTPALGQLVGSLLAPGTRRFATCLLRRFAIDMLGGLPEEGQEQGQGQGQKAEGGKGGGAGKRPAAAAATRASSVASSASGSRGSSTGCALLDAAQLCSWSQDSPQAQNVSSYMFVHPAVAGWAAAERLGGPAAVEEAAGGSEQKEAEPYDLEVLRGLGLACRALRAMRAAPQRASATWLVSGLDVCGGLPVAVAVTVGHVARRAAARGGRHGSTSGGHAVLEGAMEALAWAMGWAGDGLGGGGGGGGGGGRRREGGRGGGGGGGGGGRGRGGSIVSNGSDSARRQAMYMPLTQADALILAAMSVACLLGGSGGGGEGQDGDGGGDDWGRGALQGCIDAVVTPVAVLVPQLHVGGVGCARYDGSRGDWGRGAVAGPGQLVVKGLGRWALGRGACMLY